MTNQPNTATVEGVIYIVSHSECPHCGANILTGMGVAPLIDSALLETKLTKFARCIECQHVYEIECNQFHDADECEESAFTASFHPNTQSDMDYSVTLLVGKEASAIDDAETMRRHLEEEGCREKLLVVLRNHPLLKICGILLNKTNDELASMIVEKVEEGLSVDEVVEQIVEESGIKKTA